MMVPRDIQILIPGTCEFYFTWKRDFTDEIIVRILRWEDDPRLLRWALSVINKKDPYKKDTERDLSTEKRKCESEGEKAMSYRKGSLAKESSRSSPENRKDKRGDCSSEPPKEPNLTTP